MTKKAEPIWMEGIVIWSIIGIVSGFIYFGGIDIMRYISFCFIFLTILGIFIVVRERKYMWDGKLVRL